MNLRRGVPEDAAALTAVAFAAKGHWGYSAAQLQAWRKELTVGPGSMPVWPVCVAVDNGEPAGFIQVNTDSRPWALEAMWVHPAHMGKGIGKALLDWAAALAAAGGQAELAIDADPNAAGFYRARGARVVGSVAAPIDGDPKRVRPQLRLPTREA